MSKPTEPSALEAHYARKAALAAAEATKDQPAAQAESAPAAQPKKAPKAGKKK